MPGVTTYSALNSFQVLILPNLISVLKKSFWIQNTHFGCQHWSSLSVFAKQGVVQHMLFLVLLLRYSNTRGCQEGWRNANSMYFSAERLLVLITLMAEIFVSAFGREKQMHCSLWNQNLTTVVQRGPLANATLCGTW